MAEGTVTLAVVSQSRAPVGQVEVPSAVDAGPVREHLLHAAVHSQLAARRAGPAAREGAGRPGAERLRRARARPPRADAGGAGSGRRPPRRARVNPGDVVQGPIITEKGTLVNEQGNQVVFRVHPHANKVEIRQAIESLFRVKVEKVRTSRQLGKVRRVGRHQGRRPDWKKAYVTLAEGSRIDFFEGA